MKNKLALLAVMSCLMFSSANCFAEWRNIEEIYNDKLENGELGICSDFKTKGLHLVASNENSVSHFRVNEENKVDYLITIRKHLSIVAYSLFIELLDEDMFLLERKYLTALTGLDKDELTGSFNITKNTLEKVKYYNLTTPY